VGNGNLYASMTERFPADLDQPCLMHPEGGAVTYRTLDARSAQLANLFVDAGCHPLGEDVVPRIVGEASLVDELVTQLLERLSFSECVPRPLLEIADRKIDRRAVWARSQRGLAGRGERLDCRWF